jgi:hypothetical protein
VGPDNLDQEPRTAALFRLVTVDDPFSYVERRHMCPPFHYSNTGNMVVELYSQVSKMCNDRHAQDVPGDEAQFTIISKNLFPTP